MEDGAGFHFLLAVDGCDFDHGFDVVGRVEEGEAFGEDGEENDAGGPHVDFGGLGRAFEQYFGGAEASCAGPVGAAGGALVVFGIARGSVLVGGFA